MDRKNTFKRAVNLVTVLGGGMSAGALFFVFAGEAYLRTAWLCLGIGLLIDSIDGTVVRVLGLDQSLPRYDGERLDEYADLVTYVVAPVGFAWGADLLPADWFGFVTGVVLCAASMLQFSRTDNKTEN
ncbi:MAG: CDP-alcohol phosphatidyltransferase family protein, partial [Bradymonadaceae bacterium]